MYLPHHQNQSELLQIRIHNYLTSHLKIDGTFAIPVYCFSNSSVWTLFSCRLQIDDTPILDRYEQWREHLSGRLADLKV